MDDVLGNTRKERSIKGSSQNKSVKKSMFFVALYDSVDCYKHAVKFFWRNSNNLT